MLLIVNLLIKTESTVICVSCMLEHVCYEPFLLDTATWAVSSQGMQDHFGAKFANWLAGYRNCQPHFQLINPSRAEP